MQTLKLFINLTNNFVRVLRVLDCENVKELNSTCYECNNGLVTEVYKVQIAFNEIVKLLTIDQMKELAKHLPYITEFDASVTKNDSNTESKIISIFSIFPNLIKLYLALDYRDRFPHGFECQSINELHVRFTALFPWAEITLVLTVEHEKKEIFFTSNDKFFKCDDDLMELHWMENFNEENIRQTIENVVLWYRFKGLKFINNCTCDLDIAILSRKTTRDIEWLEIHSKRYPICFDSHNLYHFYFFSRLSKLKIHLENHTAIDFLRNFEPKLCARITELWINTKTVEKSKQVEYDNEMKQILEKFLNLKSLHLDEPFENLAQ